MRPLRYAWTIVVGALLGINAGCGAPGVPVPPSLELPQPVSDLHAMRKGDNVLLVWTAPTRTTDGRTIRHPGPTVICRSLEPLQKDCATALAEIPPAGLATVQPKTNLQSTYTDTLPEQLQRSNPIREATYAVSAKNASG